MTIENKTPDILYCPIADQASGAEINAIPVEPVSGTANASQKTGFPPITMMPEGNGGEPPYGQDFNGLFNLISQHSFFQQNGGSYTYNPDVASAIGGYAKNTILWHFPPNGQPYQVVSLINNNTNNFVADPSKIDNVNWSVSYNGIKFWQPEMPVIQYQTIVQYQTGTDFPRLYINITGTSTETAPDTDTTNWLMFLDTGASYADIDASNFSVTGKSFLSGLGMPSSRAIDVTLGASGARYTAPGNGYFTAYNANNANGAVRFVNITKGIGMNSAAVVNLSDGLAFVPAEKNDIVDMFYTGTFNTSGNGWFRFVYAEGDE